MNLRRKTLVACALLAGLSLPALAVDNLLLDPGFEGPPYGDGWGEWGATDFNAFWGPDVHASLYADWYQNYGGVYQVGVAGVPGARYQFVLYNTRIEPNWRADLYFGVEYYAGDDGTKLGETMVLIDTAARLANAQVDGNVFTMQGVAVPGTVFVRPVFRFDNVDPNYSDPNNLPTQTNAFVFDTFLSLAPGQGDEFLKNPGFEDTDPNSRPGYGDYWGKWGNTDFNSFWGINGHASFFADTIGNSGGVYQQGILGTAGAHYQLDLADVRIEQNWDADLYFGLEYYGDNDFNKLGETMVQADTSQPGDGQHFSMAGTAVAGTVYVRPLIRFDNVGSSGGSDRNLFIFAAALTEVVPTGACCTPTGSCSLTTQGNCQLPNVWHGEWTSCTPNNCPQPPTGACCAVPALTCTVTTEAVCQPPNFFWKGAGTVCTTPNICGCKASSNCDNVVSWRDIDYFVAAQNDAISAWYKKFLPNTPSCSYWVNDVNNDNHVSWRDITPFVQKMNMTCPHP